MLEGEEARGLAYNHAIEAEWNRSDAEAYAQGYVDAIAALEIPPNAQGYALGYAEAIIHWFISQSPHIPAPELVMGESALTVVYARGDFQAFCMGLSSESRESYAQACKQGYADAGARLGTSPSNGQAYAYGYAQALVGHVSTTLNLKFVGGHLHGLAEALALLQTGGE